MLRNFQEYTTVKKTHHRDQQDVHSGKSEDTCIKLENIEG